MPDWDLLDPRFSFSLPAKTRCSLTLTLPNPDPPNPALLPTPHPDQLTLPPPFPEPSNVVQTSEGVEIGKFRHRGMWTRYFRYRRLEVVGLNQEVDIDVGSFHFPYGKGGNAPKETLTHLTGPRATQLDSKPPSPIPFSPTTADKVFPTQILWCPKESCLKANPQYGETEAHLHAAHKSWICGFPFSTRAAVQPVRIFSTKSSMEPQGKQNKFRNRVHQPVHVERMGIHCRHLE